MFEILGKAREKLKWADGKAVKAEIDMQVCGTIACYKSVLLSSCHSVCPSVVTPSVGNCEEELPEKPVGRLSVNCRPTVDRQVTDSLPTG